MMNARCRVGTPYDVAVRSGKPDTKSRRVGHFWGTTSSWGFLYHAKDDLDLVFQQPSYGICFGKDSPCKTWLAILKMYGRL